MLDAVTPNNPILLNDTSGHSAWVNTSALEIAGITKDTPDPQGGIIERDSAGNPTGVLRESAIEIARKHIPAPSDEDIKTSLKWAINNMLSYGITAYNEASLGFVAGVKREAEIYAELADEGFIKQRTRLCLTWFPGGEKIEEVIAARNLYARDRLAPDCIKIFLDGVPTDSHTGAMVEPYADTKSGAHNKPEKGILMVQQDSLEAAVTLYDFQGLNIKFHAAGDGAVRAGLDAVAKARDTNGFGGPSHHVGHSTFVHEDDITRADSLQMTWEFSPYIWYPTPITADVQKAVGDERMKRWLPVRDALDTGVNVVVGSDWSVVPSVNPWLAMETLVTRQKPGGSKETVGEQERISLEEALRIYTENGAKLMGHRNLVGSIEIGMHADVIITAANPFKIPITDLHNMKVKMTFIDGEKVYDAASPPKSTAE